MWDRNQFIQKIDDQIMVSQKHENAIKIAISIVINHVRWLELNRFMANSISTIFRHDKISRRSFQLLQFSGSAIFTQVAFRVGRFEEWLFCTSRFVRLLFAICSPYENPNRAFLTSDGQKCAKVQILRLGAGLKGFRSEDIIAAF